jgi:phage repressor protein C with HTH and peptisase S24 domain
MLDQSVPNTQALGCAYMTLGEKIRALREVAGLTQQQIADDLGITAVSVSDWESGKTRPSGTRFARLARKLGVTVDQLLSPDPIDSRRPLSFPPRTQRIPVVGTAQLGADGYWAELGHPVGSGDGYLDVPSDDANAYAVRVVGDSMYPRIRSGEFVLCEPNHTYGPGDEVLVVTTDGRSMVKEFLYQRDGQVVLHSVNDGHGRLTLRAEDVEKIHYVAAIVKAARWRER